MCELIFTYLRGMDIRPSGSQGAKVKRSDSAPIRVSRFSSSQEPVQNFRVQLFETLRFDASSALPSDIIDRRHQKKSAR